MEQYAIFLAATVLVSISLIVITIAIVVINNILYKYWNKLNMPIWFSMNHHYRFATEDELKKMQDQIEPKFSDSAEKK